MDPSIHYIHTHTHTLSNESLSETEFSTLGEKAMVVVVVAAITSSRQDRNLVSFIVGVNLLHSSLQFCRQAEERRDKAGAPVGLGGGG